MTAKAVKPTIARASLDCLSTARNKVLCSSREIGWSSLLVDHLEGSGDSGVYEKPVTPDVTIAICLSGRYLLAVHKNGHWNEAKQAARSMACMRSGESNRLRWRSGHGERFTLANIYLPSLLFLQAADHFRRAGLALRTDLLPAQKLDTGVIESTASALIHAVRVGSPDLYAEQAAIWLASHLVCMGQTASEHGRNPRKAGALSDTRLARITEYMGANLGRQLTVAELAREAGISPFHFSRRFKLASGSTPHKYLTGLRMVAAQHLLKTSHKTISEIASECGYLTPSAFAAAFSLHFGSSPRSQRRHKV